ncbi:MAG: hypothetical protein WBB85_16710 [Albidovulum sp.]|uniref:hypothetical protein n=1 Tax=Albidovulum sp. TaxID=1872424 RepID=UPI003CB37663
MLLLNQIPDHDVGLAQRTAMLRGQVLAVWQAARRVQSDALSAPEREEATRAYIGALEAIMETVNMLYITGAIDQLQNLLDPEPVSDDG